MKINAPREELLNLAARLSAVLELLGDNYEPTNGLFTCGLCFAVNNVMRKDDDECSYTALMADIAESVGIEGGMYFLGPYGNWQLRAAYARLLIAYIEETV